METEVILLIISSFYFFLPAGFANMSPVLTKKINFLNYPIDFGIKFKEKRIFGKNKTWRGFFSAIIISIIIISIQKYLFSLDFFSNISIIQYDKINILLLGILFGLGAMTGDLIESFIKRRFSYKPAQKLIIADQIDWVIGSMIFILPIIRINTEIIITILITYFILHLITKHIGFFLKMEESKW